MNLALDKLWHSSMRQPLFAANGVVAASQPLAAQAGLTMLQRGGNAVDAALATAITLAVVSPSNNDVGGDAFALVWDGKQLHGLNGSGRTPAAHTLGLLQAEGYSEMPQRGWPSVTVPGAPAAWRDLHQRFGRLSFADLFTPAIAYAEEGFPVTAEVAFQWRYAVARHANLQGELYDEFGQVFTPEGRVPQVGERWGNPLLAQTLHRIAETDAAAFYQGEITEKIANFAARTGGWLTAEDLATHTSTWVDPISTNYRGYDIWEMPPNGQGLATLLALNLLEGFALADHERESVESYHLQMEAMKLGFVDVQRYVADPAHVDVPTTALLDKAYATQRRLLITEQASDPAPGDPLEGGTVYFCTADADGMMVSFIQSNYDSFGAHIVVPETGICLQNRGSGFSLNPDHPNHIDPGKRPFHTIIPGFITHQGEAIGSFGVMGGHMQPQGHLQMVVNTLDYGFNPQVSLDAPRWYWGQGKWVQVEPTVSPTIVEGLRQRGHDIHVDDELDFVGTGQIIWRLASGIYVAGSDGRTDGCAVGY